MDQFKGPRLDPRVLSRRGDLNPQIRHASIGFDPEYSREGGGGLGPPREEVGTRLDPEWPRHGDLVPPRSARYRVVPRM